MKSPFELSRIIGVENDIEGWVLTLPPSFSGVLIDDVEKRVYIDVKRDGRPAVICLDFDNYEKFKGINQHNAVRSYSKEAQLGKKGKK